MTIDLSKPLCWTKASFEEQAMLNDLQGNILKSHGRPYATHFLLRFDDPGRARMCVGRLAEQVKSAAEQLSEARSFKKTGQSAGRFLSLLLSASGYRALELPESATPPEAAFLSGMRQRGVELDDPPAITWEPHFQGDIHGLLLIAHDSAPAMLVEARRLRWRIGEYGGVSVIGEELGATIKNRFGKNIEHFGYRDGLSDPVMLEEDLQPTEGLQWNPAAPLEQVLVADPGSPEPTGFGSYVVFRKLEQNVRLFKEAEERLAHTLGLEGEDEERAGALIVGRFESGTPLILSNHDDLPSDSEIINNFSYASDAQGRRCPFHAHIRKVNPRGESVPQFSRTLAEERSRRIVRRGITYGERSDDPSAELPSTARPTGGVGLLFIAYQSAITKQFEHIQRYWANNSQFGRENTGIDPLIGQQHLPNYHWPVSNSLTAVTIAAPFSMGNFVTLKGGEYFFAPCISFLKSLTTKGAYPFA